MKVKDYVGVKFESSTRRTEEYVAFERQCKKELKAMLKKYDINLHRFDGNHFDWDAVLERNGKFVYVRVGDVRCWDWYNDVLIRTMVHDKDWTGGHNNKCAFNEIGEFADKLLNG